ncbi:MAG: hypothetical protein ACI4S2_10510 [Lachnospiraceae bacterium]
MILHEMLKDEREAGKQEGISKGKSEAVLDILEDLGEVPEDLRQRISDEKNLTVLKKYLQQAVKSESIEQFIKAIS